MFEYLKGKVEYKKPDYLALDVNGVGYRVNISLRTYDEIKTGQNIKLFIYNFVKEDSYRLIGFLNEGDRNTFELLLGVKGIGMSLALAIMSTFDVESLKSLIANEDYKTLKRVPKLGEKKAHQIILDLKGKIKTIGGLFENNGVMIDYHSIEEELYEALESLGYSKKEIDALITAEELREYKSVEDAIKGFLKKVRY